MGASALLESQSVLLVLSVLCLLIVLVTVVSCFRVVLGYKHKEQQLHEKLKQVELQYNEVSLHQRHLLEKNDALQVELTENKDLNARLNKNLHQAERARDVALSEAQQCEKNIQEKRQQLEALQSKYEEKQEQFNLLNTDYTQLKTELEERQSNHQKQLAQFEEQKKTLSEQFKLLASDILDAKTKALQETNQHSLTSVMSPFKEAIDSFKKEVQDIHHRETTQQGELRKELETLKELNQRITTEAHELSTALKGQKKLQGNWGELVLENVLDRSGLQLGKDYKREVSITTEEGKQRPDAIIYLPQNKHLIIDAKVSLNAYTRYINSDDEIERKLALAEHVNNKIVDL